MAVAEKKTLKIGEGKRGPGRPKGLRNKNTTLLKDAILLAAQQAGGGGEDGLAQYLSHQARENPGPFMTLLGKVLPLTLGGDPSGVPIKQLIQVVTGVDRAPGD